MDQTIVYGAEAGFWGVESVAITDSVGNYTYVYEDELATIGFDTGITNTATSYDAGPPTLTGFTLSPLSVDTSESDQTVTATVSIADDFALPESGSMNVEVRLTSPSGGQSLYFVGYTGSEEPGGTDLQRSFAMDQTIVYGAETGFWGVESVAITDKVGNYTYLYEDDLATMGFVTGIQNQ